MLNLSRSPRIPTGDNGSSTREAPGCARFVYPQLYLGFGRIALIPYGSRGRSPKGTQQPLAPFAMSSGDVNSSASD